MKVLYALVLLLIVKLAYGQQSYPSLPLVFTSDIDISIENSQFPFPQSMSGRLYYDYTQLTQRQDAVNPMQGTTMSKLDRFDQMNTYQWIQGDSQCDCEALTGTLPLYSVLPGSKYNGQSNVNGIDADAWVFTLVEGTNITLYVDPLRDILVQSVMMVDNSGMQITTTMTFTNVDTGAIDASVFNPPSFCACPTPAPPVTPSPTACPNNPPANCHCLSSPLSFCSEVNYPISANSDNDAQTTDAMVQEMFNNFVQFSQPSQQCETNTKAFLCATMFSLCNSEPIIALPCSNLCPTCSCGSSGNNTCAAALPNTYCTQYGQGFC